MGKPSAWKVLGITSNGRAAKQGRVLKRLARRAMADNATDLNYPAFVEFQARQLYAAHGRATAICADEEPSDGGIFPPASSCVDDAKAWARQAAAG